MTTSTLSCRATVFFILCLSTAVRGWMPIVSWTTGSVRSNQCSTCKTVRRISNVMMKSASAETVVDRVDLWVRGQTFNELLDKAEVRKLLTELSEDDQYWKGQRQKFNDLHQEIDQWLRTEKRPLNEILSADFSNKVWLCLQLYFQPFLTRMDVADLQTS